MTMAHIITDCADHGDKRTTEYLSALAYIEDVAHCQSDLDHERDTGEDVGQHAAWHEREGHDCWVCCHIMVIDPTDILGPVNNHDYPNRVAVD